MRISALIISLLTSASVLAQQHIPADVVWTTPSKNSSESMPCGGRDVGLNVWVENGDLLFYMSKSGSFDEFGTMLKMGRIRLHFNNIKLGDSKDFRQVLKTYDGYVYVSQSSLFIKLWVDVNTGNIHLEASDKKKLDAQLTYETWRYKDSPIRKGECWQGAYRWVNGKQTCTYADSIKIESRSMLSFCHTNRSKTVYDDNAKLQGLDGNSTVNGNRNMMQISNVGIISLTGMRFTGKTVDGQYLNTPYRGWTANTESNRKKISASIGLANNYEFTVYGDKLEQKDAKAFEQTKSWWHKVWERSYIDIEGEHSNLSRNYALFRYMLGCNAFGTMPTKFNGGLFTFDPVLVADKYPYTPDYRRWGGSTFTAQNQRLVYWPMLKNGDAEWMRSQFASYSQFMYPNAKARCQEYWHHPGACFTEQTEFYGLPDPAEYGMKHPATLDRGVEYNAWLEYTWDTVLEFASMALDAHSYSGTYIDQYEDWMLDAVRFFDEHYRYLAKQRGHKDLDGNGKLILYPGSACETYKMAYNSSSTVAALQVVTAQLLKYFSTNTEDTTAVNYLKGLQQRIPDIAYREIDGNKTISPAVVWERVQNEETPQLYPVFPWRIYGVGCSADSLKVALNTYRLDPDAVKFRSSKGWKQDAIWAACLGITDDAEKLVTEKLSDGPFRFPAFWGPGFDWAPDHNWGGSGMIALQEMLVQERDGKIYLFPAWPKSWNVSFKLHLEGKTTVEAQLKDGKATYKVFPATRTKDIVVK